MFSKYSEFRLREVIRNATVYGYAKFVFSFSKRQLLFIVRNNCSGVTMLYCSQISESETMCVCNSALHRCTFTLADRARYETAANRHSSVLVVTTISAPGTEGDRDNDYYATVTAFANDFVILDLPQRYDSKSD